MPMTLSEFFAEHPRAAVAFSGGVDSAYLLYAAVHCGASVCAYYVKSAFQPQFELDDALRLAEELGVELCVIELDVLGVPCVSDNPSNRCYYCKKAIFTAIINKAAADGCSVVLDGTNASDDISDRPGVRALKELSVLSPLRECGLTKSEIRALSRECGLFTWDKPAYACLATRIPFGTKITAEKLELTEKAENYLAGIGFRDFRVRLNGTDARIEVTESQLGLLFEKRQVILEQMKKWYSSVTVNLEVRK